MTFSSGGCKHVGCTGRKKQNKNGASVASCRQATDLCSRCVSLVSGCRVACKPGLDAWTLHERRRCESTQLQPWLKSCMSTETAQVKNTRTAPSAIASLLLCHRCRLCRRSSSVALLRSSSSRSLKAHITAAPRSRFAGRERRCGFWRCAFT